MNQQNATAPKRINPTALFLAGVALALCYGLVGKGDYEQAVADQKLHCQMEKMGAWPKRFEEKCGAPTLKAAPSNNERLAQL